MNGAPSLEPISVIWDMPNARAAAFCSSMKIAAMPLPLQAKMLRVLEERSFHRVGGESPIPLKARIVCATSESLDEQARRGAFREDLLYRINAVTVELPPLRERPEDISWLLSRYFSLFRGAG